MSDVHVGKRVGRNGQYEITIWMDAGECEDMADLYGVSDTFRRDLLAAAEEIRAKEATLDEGPGLRFVVSERRRG